MNPSPDTKVSFVLSRQGSKLLKIGRYFFGLHGLYGPKMRWRCTGHSRGCKAVVHTVEQLITKTFLYHNH